MIDMRCIDADALIDLYKDSVGYSVPVGVIIANIEDAPTIEPERKKGEWIESDTDGFVCSVCRNGYKSQPTLMGKPMFEYCPVCGADMRKEGDTE